MSLTVAIEIPQEVMNSLPAHAEALVIDFPIQARDTPSQYMLLDWNPQGHEPVGNSAAEFADFVKSEREKVGRIVHESHIGAD